MVLFTLTIGIHPSYNATHPMYNCIHVAAPVELKLLPRLLSATVTCCAMGAKSLPEPTSITLMNPLVDRLQRLKGMHAAPILENAK